MTVSLSCSDRTTHEYESGLHYADSLEYYREQWRKFNNTGSFDSLITVTKPFYRKAVQAGDSVSALYAGVFIAQAYLFEENADSVQKYIESVSRFIDSTQERAMTVYENVQGGYALKMLLDYPLALEHYLRALRWSEMSGSNDNSIVILSNIVSIFYVRSDSHGLPYARQAFRLASEQDVDEYMRCLALVDMGHMYYLSEELDSAMIFSKEAEFKAGRYSLRSLYTVVSLLLGNIHDSRGDSAEAGRYYSRALDYSKYTDIGTVTLAYLSIGYHYESVGDLIGARDMFVKGLELSYHYRNKEFRKELLRGLSDIWFKLGDMENAAVCFDRYRSYLDTVDNMRKEHDFNDLLLQYRDIEHRLEVESKELELLRSEREKIVLACICVVSAVMLLSLFTIYRRQKKTHRLLVAKHQEYVEQFNVRFREMEESMQSSAPGSGSGETGTQEDDADKDLFMRIEQLMRSSRIYRRNNITREEVAAMLDTNRTYLSRAINTYAGKSFNNYINTYRINEAVGIFSSVRKDIPLKQLAEELGFGSVSVFYKVFKKETGCTVSVYKKELTSAKTAK